MEETIKVQEEFENLIEQLERLRNINDLTSTNTESSRLVLEKIDAFISSINDHKKKIEEDLAIKSKSIEGLISHLGKSINSIEHQSQLLSNSIESSFGVLKNETGEHFGSLSEVVYEKIDLAQKLTLDLKKDLILKFDKSTEDLIVSFKDQSNKITDLINENGKTIENTIFENSNEHISQLKTGIGNLNKISEKQFEQVKMLLENQAKEIKILKAGLFIISGLIIIGFITAAFVL